MKWKGTKTRLEMDPECERMEEVERHPMVAEILRYCPA